MDVVRLLPGHPGRAHEREQEESARVEGRQERAEKQDDWHKRLDQAQKDVATWRAEADRIQSVLNDSTAPQYGAGRAAKVEALETAKRNLAAASQTLSDLQEEGRRNGYR